MPNVSNVQNGLGTFQRLRLYKYSLLRLFLSPKPLPSFSKLTTSPPSQSDGATTHTHFILPSSTSLRCTTSMLPLYNPLVSSDSDFFSMHRFSPPYMRSPIP